MGGKLEGCLLLAVSFSYHGNRNFHVRALIMIYAHIDMTPDAPKYQPPPRPDFYLCNDTPHSGGPEHWTKNYWDGQHWYYVEGGKQMQTQNWVWRVITKEK